mmetsp:Transcript_13042/g.30009  ORF Transcript_13042/g.30009 Transcript_13042/m.30009 type:complete len:420 (-) Transcript_13042:29-1288(-)
MSCIAVADDVCANCGKGSASGSEGGTVKLKNCTACRLVKYCSVGCQKAHRKQHKNACEKRAAELLQSNPFASCRGLIKEEQPCKKAAELKEEQLYSQGHERTELNQKAAPGPPFASTLRVTASTNVEDMRGIFRELFDSEIRFMKGLGEETLKKMCGGSWDPRFCEGGAPINHFSTSGEIGLVLAGVKPCSVVAHHNLQEYGQLLYRNVLRPWYEKYFSEDSGFVCELGSPGCAWYESDSGVADIAGGASMFINLNHSDASYAIGILRTKNSRATTQEELRKVFGYPASDEGGIESLIEYQFQNPASIYKIKNCCCSPCLDFRAIESDAASVGRHFRQCREGMLKLGYSLALDVYHQDEWSPRAVATAWYYAAGCDMEECLQMLQADQVWMRCCGHRKEWLIRELFNMRSRQPSFVYHR